MTELPEGSVADATAPLAAASAPPAADHSPAAMPPVWPSISHTLLYPLTVKGSDPVTVITVSEPDLETMERLATVVATLGLSDEDARIPVKLLRPMLHGLTEIPLESLKRLHFKDATALMEKMAPLLEGLAG